MLKTKIIRIVRNNWITIWLLIISISFSSFVSYAAYTGTTTAKRVISLSRRDSILFSSRYMTKSGTGMQPILISYPEGTTPETPIIAVDVCNYDSNGNVYGSNFSYRFKARLVKNNGNDITQSEWDAIADKPTAYKVSFKSVSSSTLPDEYVNGLSHSEITLTNVDQYVTSGQVYQFYGSDKTRYIFESKFDVNDIIGDTSAYGIRIEAELVGTYNDLENISGMMKVLKGGATTPKTWEGKYMDVTSGRNPADYDAINYQISGNAVGTVSLKYRCDCVEIDKDCLTRLGNSVTSTVATESITIGEGSSATTVSVKYKTLSIPVNPDLYSSMYDIQFYWVDGRVDLLEFDDSFIQTTFS